ncbi:MULTISPECIES: hypothetical protein [Paenibacillus]|uniref:Periplasmic protein n=1 Tax=Paenibacillus baimaensis TaxID=2982185 RepID=A0ABT2UKV5_9BACL|nr:MULTISPECIES: hypothetical protein [unclassified Paenibacillus]MCU6795248.1 hypothetical protein [Paenibacillus sp. WQ 127069]OMF14526.1 hypothetical protein BK127_17555 [Paenibacillus sp. FSL H7-0331]
MRDRTIERSNGCEPFFVSLGNKSITDIVITNHAQIRWNDRVEHEKTGFEDICAFLWNRLKAGQIKSYYKNGEDAYLVDDDLVLIAEFTEMENLSETGPKLHRMVIVTFLGRMSETIELRDLKSYYSWLRHSRRMTLIKNSRKRR